MDGRLLRQDRHLDFEVARRLLGNWLGQVVGRLHVGQQAAPPWPAWPLLRRATRDRCGRGSSLIGSLRYSPNQVADAGDRHRRAQFRRRGVGPQQPAADGQGELVFGGHVPHRRRSAGRPPCGRGCRSSRSAAISFCNGRTARRVAASLVFSSRGGDLRQGFLPPGMHRLVFLDQLSHRLERIAGNVLGREPFQHRKHQAVLAGGAAAASTRRATAPRRVAAASGSSGPIAPSLRCCPDRPEDGLQLLAAPP